MHANSPTVTRLQLHLPDQQPIIFTADNGHERIHEPNLHKTTLTEFFETCKKYPDLTRNLTYPKMPETFTWDASKKQWKLRQRGHSIGRVYFAGPSAGERYYLRTLLYVVKEPHSWEDLRTVNGITYDTFKEACSALGLLDSDEEYEICLREAALMQTGRQLRHLFSIILLQCSPNNPRELWNSNFNTLSDDCHHRLQHLYKIAEPTNEQIQSFALRELDNILQQSGKCLSDFHLPAPTHDFHDTREHLSRRIAEEKSYDTEALKKVCEQNISSLNTDQRQAYDQIIAAYEKDQPKIFFLDGPGGTGKTHVENTVLAKVRSANDIALACASSGIAALLLTGGRTAHSSIKIPIDIHADSFCAISAQSELAQLIRLTKLIIWDEAPMHHRFCAEAVDRTFRDIRHDDRPFGGITMVFTGMLSFVIPPLYTTSLFNKT